MAKPTVKALLREFRDLDPKVAKELVHTMNSGLSAGEVDDFMRVANQALGTFGVESISSRNVDSKKLQWTRMSDYWGSYLESPTLAIYCNTGDTYDTTLLYDTVKRKFSLTSWGDFVEHAPKWYGLDEE